MCWFVLSTVGLKQDRKPSCFLYSLGPIRKYPADLKVMFKDTTALVGQDVILECFALGKWVCDVLKYSHDIQI